KRVAVVEDVFIESVCEGVLGDRGARQHLIAIELHSRKVVDFCGMVGDTVFPSVPVTQQSYFGKLGATTAESGHDARRERASGIEVLRLAYLWREAGAGGCARPMTLAARFWLFGEPEHRLSSWVELAACRP